MQTLLVKIKSNTGVVPLHDASVRNHLVFCTHTITKYTPSLVCLARTSVEKKNNAKNNGHNNELYVVLFNFYVYKEYLY